MWINNEHKRTYILGWKFETSRNLTRKTISRLLDVSGIVVSFDSTGTDNSEIDKIIVKEKRALDEI